MRRMSLTIAIALALAAVGCKGRTDDHADHAKQPAAEVAKPAARVPAKGPPGCTPDPQRIARPHHTQLAVVDDALIGASWDAQRGVVLAHVDDGKPFGAPVALPSSPMGRVFALVRTDEGLAAIVRLFDHDDDDGGRLVIARFDRAGAPIGAAHELAHDLAPLPMPGFDVAAAGDRLVLLEETKMLAHTQLQVVDLDGKAIGAAVDGQAGRIGAVAPIGVGGHQLAIALRDSEAGDERVRVFDADKGAWVAPAVPAAHHVYGAAPYASSAVLLGVAGGPSLAAVTADGKLGAWKPFGDADRAGHWIAAAADGSHTYVETAVKQADGTFANVIGAVQPDLAVLEDPGLPGTELSGDEPVVGASTIYEPVEDRIVRLRCAK